MSATILQTSILAVAVAAGLTAGMTFAFSNFIIRAFDRLEVPEAVRAMQQINRAVFNPLFMLVFIGTGGIALLIAIASTISRGGVEPWLLAGTLVYVFGVVLITARGNVPLNDRLDAVTDETVTTQTWREFARPWTAYNHLRTVAAALASLAFMIAAFR